jgi:signal transduction histidine kinase
MDQAVGVLLSLGPVAVITVSAVLIVADRIASLQRQVVLAGAVTVALNAMIDDLFELSRLEAGDIRWSIRRVRLDALLTEAVDALRPQADAGGVAVSAEVDPDLEPARADPEQLQRVLFNLIENAIHDTPSDGSVVVRARPGYRQLQIEVADTGVGIPDDERERVFDAFFRGGAHAARGDAGAGLGLAISRAIVEAHGGRIWLAGSGPGTRVRFSLPAADPHHGGRRPRRRRQRALEVAKVSRKRSSSGTMRSCASSWR